MDKSQIRHAATVIILREDAVLMGQRGASAAFMPGKFVFPGGAVDHGDAQIDVGALPEPTATRLTGESTLSPQTLAAAAIRELWEETGQILGTPADWADAPQGWRGFARTGHRPDARKLEFFFRAVTPQGRPRRFDARFFLAGADALCSDPDDFSNAEDELSHLQWVPLRDARKFDLPFITQVVIAELASHLKTGGTPAHVPFFRNDDEAHLVSRLGGAPVL
ncbi:NUDIX hydrolase [Yoonia sp. 208BN28-4]|uniref:NUDIX hydrolase n=1 Tax=Yoonia sp. 208BN28-4 TaxID=3126505 RepID=UPI0030B3574D